MAADLFWAVRCEAALALAAIKTEAARDEIGRALGAEKHPKARRLMARALGAFRHDARAAELLGRKLAGDESYLVEAECALSIGMVRGEGALEQLKTVMSRPSHLDSIRSACLRGLAELRDERGIDIAFAATRYGEPVLSRKAALAALGVLGAEAPERRRQIREHVEQLLEDPEFRVRLSAVDALRTLGDPAALPALARAESRDLDGRVRRRAREVSRLLSTETARDSGLRQLREGHEKLESENRELKDRVERLEALIKERQS